MKKIAVYNVYADDKLRFSSVDQKEVDIFCSAFFDDTGERPTIEKQEYQPIDHASKSKKGFVKHGSSNKYKDGGDKVIEETYRTKDG